MFLYLLSCRACSVPAGMMYVGDLANYETKNMNCLPTFISTEVMTTMIYLLVFLAQTLVLG